MTDPSGRALTPSQPLPVETAIELLSCGEMHVQGLIPWSSNYTFLVVITHADRHTAAVYKPCRGEQPLWDFPTGTLANREVAAYLVSEALGWLLVPPTVLRDGPHGMGMAQFYVDANPDEHYFTFGKRFPDQIKKIAAFDALVNNADRKSGHCLRDANDHVWAIDHGICFHAEPKLRTVIWEFAGRPIPAPLLRDLAAFRECFGARSDPLTKALNRLLAREEVAALRDRADELIAHARFPRPGAERHIPWPPV
jgi:uncharacterized repeat protein (TIGR03843 family)